MRHLNAFYVFHITAQSVTYTEAAQTLHITHGAVSKQIKVLENYLGQALFYKQGRTMCLTYEGERLKEHTDVAFDSLERGIKQLIPKNNNHLNVSCEPTLTMRWLMPRLSEFYNISGIDVRLSTAGGPIDFKGEHNTLAIRRDDFDIPIHYQKHVLTKEWVGPVMSPQYWRRMKESLYSIILLHSESRREAWQAWSLENDMSLYNNAGQSFEHFYFCLQAAIDGMGAAMGSYQLVVDDLKSGRLVAPFGFIPSGHDYVLLSESEHLTSIELKFLQWLESHFAKIQP